MSLIPEFKIGLWNAWIFTTYLFLFVPLYFLTHLKDRDAQEQFFPEDGEKIDSLQNSGRAFVFVYPVFLPLKTGTLWFTIGLPVIIIGMVLYASVYVTMLRTPLDKPLTTGIYRFSRHPGHVTPYIVFLGISIACASWLFFVNATAFIIMHCITAIPEERHDLERYGDAYKNYAHRTPRWLGIPKYRLEK